MSFENSLIGINNRNLKTLKISLNTSLELYKILRAHKNPIISESGIDSPEKRTRNLDEKELVMLTFLYDVNQPHSCEDWGVEGNADLPIIINVTTYFILLLLIIFIFFSIYRVIIIRPLFTAGIS